MRNRNGEIIHSNNLLGFQDHSSFNTAYGFSHVNSSKMAKLVYYFHIGAKLLISQVIRTSDRPLRKNIEGRELVGGGGGGVKAEGYGRRREGEGIAIPSFFF